NEGGQWDRAHNVFVDTWLTGGALGLGALVGLLATLARGLWRTVRDGSGHAPLLAAAVLAGLAGHLAEVSFAFQTVVTGTLFWVLVALGAALVQPHRESAASSSSRGWSGGPRLLARAESQFQEAVRRGPYDPFGHLRLARLYLAWARRSPVTRTPDELLTNADQACTLALSDTPYLARTWQSCAEVSRERGELDQAAARTERARQLGAQI